MQLLVKVLIFLHEQGSEQGKALVDVVLQEDGQEFVQLSQVLIRWVRWVSPHKLAHFIAYQVNVTWRGDGRVYHADNSFVSCVHRLRTRRLALTELPNGGEAHEVDGIAGHYRSVNT